MSNLFSNISINISSTNSARCLVAGASIAAYMALNKNIRDIADAVIKHVTNLIGSPSIPCVLTALLATSPSHQDSQDMDFTRGKTTLAFTAVCGSLKAARYSLSQEDERNNYTLTKQGLLSTALSILGILGLSLIEQAGKESGNG